MLDIRALAPREGLIGHSSSVAFQISALHIPNEFCAVLVYVFHSSRLSIVYICSKVNKLEKALEKMKDLSDSGQRLLDLEKQAGNQDEMLSKIDQAVEEKIKGITAHFEDMEKELGEINERLNLLSGGSAVYGSAKKSMAVDRQSAATVVTNFTSICFICRIKL